MLCSQCQGNAPDLSGTVGQAKMFSECSEKGQLNMLLFDQKDSVDKED